MATQNITRFMAGHAAEGMKAKAYGDVIKNSRERILDYAHKLVVKYVPKILLTDKAKEYLEVVTTITFKCNESTVGVYGLALLPKLKAIKLPRSEFDKVMMLKKEYDQNCAQSYQFCKKCVITLLDLKTVTRVKKEFPEAIEYLPKESVATPNENIASLKKML